MRVNAIRPFLIALQFLTRIPVRLRATPNEIEVGRSLLFYPVVGVLIGGLLVAADAVLSNIPMLPRAALVLAAWVLITGALHLDGLADSADAWIGGHGDRERTLAIMKDPCSGPVGVTALVLVLLLKFAALASLPDPARAPALLLAAIGARTLVPLLFLTTPYARPSGLGATLAAHVPRRAAAIIVAITAVALITAFGMAAVWALISALATFAVLRRLMHQRLGGATGDTAGALVELAECTVLIALTIIGAA